MGAMAGLHQIPGVANMASSPLGGLIGANGGAGGTGFAGPAGAQLTNPVTGAQLTSANQASQDSLAGQQQLLAMLQNQNGLNRQNDVYNQYQNIAAGQGPNPAQAMLNRATGQNVANQSAMMAGQRGANANVGLIGRQAAQVGSAAQQDAATQAASLQAQQSLGAIGQAGQMAGSMANNQIGQTNANTQANQAQQQALMQAQGAFNQSQVGSQGSVNTGNAALAQTTMQGQHALIGGLLNGAGAAMGMAQGGVVPTAPGGDAFQGPQSKFGQFLNGMGKEMAPAAGADAVAKTPDEQLQQGSSKAMSGLLGALKSKSSGGQSAGSGAMAGGMNASEISAMPVMVAAQGGRVPAMVSPGEKYLSPQAVQAVKGGANPMDVGETIPGKPKVGGAKNSYANDTVSKELEEGGVVVPRSKTQSGNPRRESADFVHRVLAKRGMKK